MAVNYQSHTFEPEIGDLVVNTNPNCKHRGSRGIVLDINSLPGDSGKTVCYSCINDGPTWSKGDTLEKTMDQLSPLIYSESRVRQFVRAVLTSNK